MSDNDLTLEKINAKRIADLDERMEKRLTHIDEKLDRIVEAMGRRSSNGGQSYAFIALFATVIISLGTILQVQIGNVNASSKERYTVSLTRAIEADNRALKALDRERESQVELSAMKEKFVEVETQFDNLDERTLRIEAKVLDKIKDLDATVKDRTAIAFDNLNTVIEGVDSRLKVEVKHIKEIITNGIVVIEKKGG